MMGIKVGGKYHNIVTGTPVIITNINLDTSIVSYQEFEVPVIITKSCSCSVFFAEFKEAFDVESFQKRQSKRKFKKFYNTEYGHQNKPVFSKR